MFAAGNATHPGPQLLNPSAPMIWVNPKLDRKMTLQGYIAVGSLSALLWDIILHIPEDYELLSKYRINSSFVVYCISRRFPCLYLISYTDYEFRIATLVYVLGLVITQTAPIGNCGYIRDISFVYTIALPSTLLLFLWRVSGLYNNNKFVVAFFSLSWLSVLASVIVIAQGNSAFRIGKSNYCSEMKAKKFSALAATIPLVHDTLIFAATSWALMQYAYADVTVKHAKVKVMVLGRHLSTFSKSILRDGQVYYLITLVVNLVFVMVAFVITSPCMFGIPTIVILNNMSCYVYRNIRFGFYRDNTFHTSAINRALETDNVEFVDQHDLELGPITTQISEDAPEGVHAERGVDCY